MCRLINSSCVYNRTTFLATWKATKVAKSNQLWIVIAAETHFNKQCFSLFVFFSQPCAVSPHKPHLPTISSDVFSSLLTLASKLMLTNLLRANWIVSHPSNQESMPIVSFSPFASRGRDWAFQVDPADAPPPCLQHPLSSCRSLFFFSSLLSIRLTRPGTTRLRNIYQPPSGSSGNIVGHATEKKEEKIELRKTQSAIAARLLRSPWLFIPEPFPEPRSTTPKPQWYAVFF